MKFLSTLRGIVDRYGNEILLASVAIFALCFYLR